MCPWCISSRDASARFDAEFPDAAAIGDFGRWDVVPKEVVDEIALKTPGFESWQGAQWLTCCDDGRTECRQVGPPWPVARLPVPLSACRVFVGAAHGPRPKKRASEFPQSRLRRRPRRPLNTKRCKTFRQWPRTSLLRDGRSLDNGASPEVFSRWAAKL